jgi:hypothetical protein
MSAPLSCAGGDQPPGKEKHDAGHGKGKDGSAHKSERGCGVIGEECCAPPTQCDLGSFCAPDNTCKDQHPPDIGQPCSSPSSCSSGICGYTQGIADGAPPVPDGNGTPPPQPTGCTVGCYNTTPDCTPGWTCNQLTVAEGLCVCTWAPEICDGMDNNCDGIIDNEPEADNYCTLMADGIPQKCVMGACACVHTCAGTCVDLQNDDMNCGMCGKACKPMVEKCQGGSCGCAYTLCGSNCVDTGGTDNKNCGGCNKQCDFTCTSGDCGPSTFYTSTSFTQIGSIVVDSTNVYWIDETTTGYLYTPQVQYCPVTGCGTTPSTLAAATVSFGEIQPYEGLVVTSSNAYFADGSTSIDTSPLTGGTGTGTLFSSNGSYNTPMVADSSNLYWIDENTYAIYSCPLGTTCGSPTTIVSTGSYTTASAIAVSGASVYFILPYSGLYSAPASGGAVSPTLVCSYFSSSSTLVVAGGYAYYADGYSAVYACPLTGGTASTYYLDSMEPSTVATDGINLYWTEATYPTGSIQKCALGATCTTPTLVVSGIQEVGDIAVGAKEIFWVSSGSSGYILQEFSK